MRGHDAGIGFSSCISVGNQADLDLTDAFEYLVEDPATRGICLYVEGLTDRHRFASIARRAREAGKPVVAVKAGRTRAGAAMASSHTGSLAGMGEVARAAYERAGIIVIENSDELFPVAETLSSQPPVKNNSIAILADGGGAVIESQARPETPLLGAIRIQRIEVAVVRAHIECPILSADNGVDRLA